MRLSELDYDLPEELIAQEPLARRDEARLLVLDRKSQIGRAFALLQTRPSSARRRPDRAQRHARAAGAPVRAEGIGRPRRVADGAAGQRARRSRWRMARADTDASRAQRQCAAHPGRRSCAEDRRLRAAGTPDRRGRRRHFDRADTANRRHARAASLYTSHGRSRRHRRLPDRVCGAARRDRGAHRRAAFHRRGLQGAGRRRYPHRAR